MENQKEMVLVEKAFLDEILTIVKDIQKTVSSIESMVDSTEGVVFAIAENSHCL